MVLITAAPAYSCLSSSFDEYKLIVKRLLIDFVMVHVIRFCHNFRILYDLFRVHGKSTQTRL